MNEINKNEKNFIGYEYKDVPVSRSMQTEYTDGYLNFGWTLEAVSPSVQRYSVVVLKFKRDRKIRNKMELTRLQRQFDSCVSEIKRLEQSKVIVASAVAYLIGLVGTALMAGAVFSRLGGMLALSIILAVPAFIGWIIPYFCFTAIQTKKTAEIDPLIDQKYDELYEVCEKAHSLLAN
jgi:hypothetical protein